MAYPTQTTAGAFGERERATAAGARPAALGAAAAGGAVAGLIGGIAMAMVAMVHAGAAGMGFWLPTKLIAATLFGVEALVGGAGVVMVGLAIHMMMSAGLGAIFGLLAGSRISIAAAAGWGLLYGVLIWAVMTYVGLPLINSVMSERMALQPGWWFAEHLVFGVMLFLTPLLARAFSGERRSRA